MSLTARMLLGLVVWIGPGTAGLITGLVIGLSLIWPGYGRSRIVEIALSPRDFGEEFAEFDEVLAEHPDWAGAHYAKGRALLLVLDYQRAIQELSLAKELEPTSPVPCFWLGIAHLRIQEWEESDEEFSEAILRGERDAFVYRFRATALMMLGRWGEAANDLQHFLSRQPEATDGSSVQSLIKRLRELERTRTRW